MTDCPSPPPRSTLAKRVRSRRKNISLGRVVHDANRGLKRERLVESFEHRRGRPRMVRLERRGHTFESSRGPLRIAKTPGFLKHRLHILVET